MEHPSVHRRRFLLATSESGKSEVAYNEPVFRDIVNSLPKLRNSVSTMHHRHVQSAGSSHPEECPPSVAISRNAWWPTDTGFMSWYSVLKVIGGGPFCFQIQRPRGGRAPPVRSDRRREDGRAGHQGTHWYFQSGPSGPAAEGTSSPARSHSLARPVVVERSIQVIAGYILGLRGVQREPALGIRVVGSQERGFRRRAG